jgi:uncharacterized protein
VVVGILQFELLIHDPESLKDKRRVLRSVKDRLHREHQVSVAEVACQDRADLAVVGLAVVGTDGKQVGQMLDRILDKLRHLREADLGDSTREIIQGVERDARPLPDLEAADALEAEMLASFETDADDQAPEDLA